MPLLNIIKTVKKRNVNIASKTMSQNVSLSQTAICLVYMPILSTETRFSGQWWFDVEHLKLCNGLALYGFSYVHICRINFSEKYSNFSEMSLSIADRASAIGQIEAGR